MLRGKQRTNLGQGEDFAFCSKSNGEPWEGWERGGAGFSRLLCESPEK